MRCPSFSIRVMAVDRGWWSNPKIQLGWGCLWLQAARCSSSSCKCLRRAQERWNGQFQTSLSRILFCPIFSKILYAISSTGIVAIMSVVVVVITWSFQCFKCCMVVSTVVAVPVLLSAVGIEIVVVLVLCVVILVSVFSSWLRFNLCGYALKL